METKRPHHRRATLDAGLVNGSAYPLGATFDGDGVNFALFSEHATSVALCLFDSDHREYRRLPLPSQSHGIWHGYLPGCQPGQRYGFRVHGPYDRHQGQRFNANKLLIDPYARELDGRFRWSPAVFDFLRHGNDFLRNDIDSAPFVPKSVVTSALRPGNQQRPAIPWSETIIYEANVRGYTMRNPDVPEAQRGTYSGMCNAAILAHLKSLGITSIELLPVQEFIDEEFLIERGQRNFWGYNSINFFTPAGRYSSSDRREEFRDMVNTIHESGLEVILDVAYNHTAESDTLGPTVAFRGIDNLTYYRTAPTEPGRYIDDTGCGNSINVDHPQVRDLIVQSLRYWTLEMGVDGFRFDLATVLGRGPQGFTAEHPLLQAIENDVALGDIKFIAEPWDIGPGGYQLGTFPKRWSEWNDRFRDSLRRFWRGDAGEAAEFAKRLHGSSDIFESAGRQPAASINMLTAHDGYTLADLVSYEQRHNEANGEGNCDGHTNNFSCNYGAEGATDDAAINAIRRRQRLNMLASLLVSQGTPMLLAGDEFGNSQRGNNNAYAQDNETGWLDWPGLDADPEFFSCVRELIQLRKNTPLLRQDDYRHGHSRNRFGWRDIQWLRPDGHPMQHDDWAGCTAMCKILASTLPADDADAIALLFNASHSPVEFQLPDAGDGYGWRAAFSSCDMPSRQPDRCRFEIASMAIACVLLRDLSD